MTSILPPRDSNRPHPAAILPGGPLGPARAALANSLVLPAHVASAATSNPRLPTDYPGRAQQSQIVEYLFQAGNGADLQTLKVEIWDPNGGSDQK